MTKYIESGTLSERGQVVIPQNLRNKAGFLPGTILNFEYKNGVITVSKQVNDAAIEKWKGKGKLTIGRTTDEYIKSIRDENGN